MKLASGGVDAFKRFNCQLGMLAGQCAVGFALHRQQGQGVCCPDGHAALRGDLLDQLLDLCVEALSLLAAEAQHQLQHNQFITLGAGQRCRVFQQLQCAVDLCEKTLCIERKEEPGPVDQQRGACFDLLDGQQTEQIVQLVQLQVEQHLAGMLFEQGGCLVCGAAVEQVAERRHQLALLFVPVGCTQIELLDHCG